MCVCVCVLLAPCVMCFQCSLSYHFLYMFVFKFVLVCTLLHAVQSKCSLVMLFQRVFVWLCMCTFQTVLYHTARRRPKWTRTPCDGFGQAETTHTRYTHTTSTLTNAGTHAHTSTSWPNYTEMRNEMETNLPREPANLERLKDTLTYRAHIHIHVYSQLHYKKHYVSSEVDIIWKCKPQIKFYLIDRKI